MTQHSNEQLVYSSVPWKIYRQDAGMGESEYAVFLGDVFYCRTDDSQTAQRIVEAIRSRPHPAPTQQRIDAEQEVIKAAMNWWMMQRPLKWSVEQHLKTPTVNCVGNQERALAEAIALLQAGEP